MIYVNQWWIEKLFYPIQQEKKAVEDKNFITTKLVEVRVISTPSAGNDDDPKTED
ncbi:MAG: hypothetical protein ABI091_10495 [Ferruginibacter sp.]